MGTPLGPKYIPYTYMDPLGKSSVVSMAHAITSQCPQDLLKTGS